MEKQHKHSSLFISFVQECLIFGSDVFAYYCSMVFSLFIRQLLPDFFNTVGSFHFSDNIQYYIFSETYIILAIIIIVFIASGLYCKKHTFWEEVLIIWKALIISSLICYLFLFNFKEILPVVSRFVIVCVFSFLSIFAPFFRLMLKKILFYYPCFRIPILIVADQNDIDRSIKIAEIFIKDVYLGFSPQYFFIENYNQTTIQVQHKSLKVINDITDLSENVVVFMVGKGLQENNHLLPKFYSRYKQVYLIPHENLLGLINSGMQYLFSECLLIIKLQNQLNSFSAYAIKFLMDKVLGTFIIILLLPMFFFVALCIKIFSPGPILYKQERVGKSGKSFWIWKFRTMYIDADQRLNLLLSQNDDLQREWNAFFKLKNDPRITSIGKFLRKYSLDEFPQLFNVLRGEMSLVGPRPFVQGEIEDKNMVLLPLYAQVKPGVTGLWQISGRNQNDRIERLSIDVWYIQNWNLSLDVLILLNTPKAVLSAKGAS